MKKIEKNLVIVAGGTGNIGTHIVHGLLKHGATVVVPSRSEEKLDGLRDYLRRSLTEADLAKLHTLVGDVGQERNAPALMQRIKEEVGEPAGVIASLGNFLPARSLLAAEAEQLRRVLDDYTVAHFTVARAFLQELADTGGKYVFVNGPLAFDPWPDSAAGLVSIATAAQHMLFRALAQELASRPVEVVELVVYTYVRRRETQPGSAVSGQAIGRYIHNLLFDSTRNRHGESVHLRSAEAAA